MTRVAREFSLPKQHLLSMKSPCTMNLFSRETKAGVHVRNPSPRQTSLSGENSPVKRKALKTRSEWDRLVVLFDWIYELEAPSKVEINQYAPQFMRTLLWTVDRPMLLCPDIWFQMERRLQSLNILDLFRDRCRMLSRESERYLTRSILFRTLRRCRVQHLGRCSRMENASSKGKNPPTFFRALEAGPPRNRHSSRKGLQSARCPKQGKAFRVAFWLK